MRTLSKLSSDIEAAIQTGEVRYIIVLIECDNGDTAVYNSAMTKSQLVYMLEDAKHDTLCLEPEDAGTDEPAAN